MGVVLIDSRGIPAFVNDVALELLSPGDGPGAVDRRRLETLLPPDLRGHERGGEARVIELGEDGVQRRVRVRSIPLEGSPGVLLVIEEATRSTALAASLSSAGHALAWTLLRWQLHDLKAPLNALALNADLLSRGLEAEDAGSSAAREEWCSTLEVMQSEIARLGRSLDALLGDGKPHAHGPRGFDACALVSDAVRLLRPSARGAVRVLTELPDEPLIALGDRDQVVQALLNVLLNALEALNEQGGGAVRVTVSPTPAMAVIDVADDGPGIPIELQARVFEMHFSTKPGGRGIGLSAARSLVEAQGGALSLESSPGQGTRVRLQVPRSR